MHINTKSMFSHLLVILTFYPLFNSKELCASTEDQHEIISEHSNSIKLNDHDVYQFKESLKNNIIIAPIDLDTIKQFISSVLKEVTAFQSKHGDMATGIALNDLAENFGDHDYFSVDRFDSALTAAQQEIENARLMENWQKWYTYKLLAYFYKKAAFTKTDEDIIDKSMRSDDLDVYRSKEYYEQIYVPGKPFYDNKNNFGQDIYMQLTEKIDGFSAFWDSLYATEEDETDTI